MVLVVHDQVDQDPFPLQEGIQRWQEPGRQGIGVDRDGHRKRLGLLGGGFGQEFAIQQRGAHQVAQQPLSGAGRAAGPASHHERLAELHFQGTHALGHGRCRQMQAGRSLLEAPGFSHGQQRLSLLPIEYQAGLLGND